MALCTMFVVAPVILIVGNSVYQRKTSHVISHVRKVVSVPKEHTCKKVTSYFINFIVIFTDKFYLDRKAIQLFCISDCNKNKSIIKALFKTSFTFSFNLTFYALKCLFERSFYSCWHVPVE